MTLKQVGLYLTHGIQHHTNCNKHPCAPKKDSDPHRNISLEEQDIREYRNDREEDRSGQGQSRHNKVQELGGWRSRTNPRHITSVLLQIIGDLNGSKHDRYPEVGEEKDHQSEDDVVR